MCPPRHTSPVYKIPRWSLGPELPKTGSGKILKRDLRARSGQVAPQGLSRISTEVNSIITPGGALSVERGGRHGGCGAEGLAG